MKKKQTIQKVLVIGIFSFLIFYSFYNYYVADVKNRLNEQVTEISDLKLETSLIGPYINKEEELNEKIKKVNENIDEINKYIPTEKDTSSVIEYFYQICKKLGVQGETITFNDVKLKNKKYAITSVKLNAIGSKEKIELLLDEIQYNTNKAIFITEISITPNEDGLYLLKSTIDIYRQENNKDTLSKN